MEGAKQQEINGVLKTVEIFERDATAIAESLTSLFSSLRSQLSEVTGASVEHMRCFNDVAGHVQESALEAASKGNHFINSCLRLLPQIAGCLCVSFLNLMQRKTLKRNVDALDAAINKVIILS